MKAFFCKVRGVTALIITILAVAFSGFVLGQATSFRPTPDAWVDSTGTNYVGFNGSAIPFVQFGPSTFTGTNQTFFITNTAGTTRTLTFKNGLLVGYF